MGYFDDLIDSTPPATQQPPPAGSYFDRLIDTTPPASVTPTPSLPPMRDLQPNAAGSFGDQDPPQMMPLPPMQNLQPGPANDFTDQIGLEGARQQYRQAQAGLAASNIGSMVGDAATQAGGVAPPDPFRQEAARMIYGNRPLTNSEDASLNNRSMHQAGYWQALKDLGLIPRDYVDPTQRPQPNPQQDMADADRGLTIARRLARGAPPGTIQDPNDPLYGQRLVNVPQKPRPEANNYAQERYSVLGDIRAGEKQVAGDVYSKIGGNILAANALLNSYPGKDYSSEDPMSIPSIDRARADERARRGLPPTRPGGLLGFAKDLKEGGTREAREADQQYERSALGRNVSGLASSLAVPMVAGAVGGPLAAAGTAGALGAGGTYNEVYDQLIAQGVPEDEAQRRAAGAGLASGAVEGAAWEAIPKGLNRLAPEFMAATKNPAKLAAQGVAMGEAFHFGSSVPQRIIQAEATGQQVDWSNLPEEIVAAAVTGAVLHGVMRGASIGTEGLVKKFMVDNRLPPQAQPFAEQVVQRAQSMLDLRGNAEGTFGQPDQGTQTPEIPPYQRPPGPTPADITQPPLPLPPKEIGYGDPSRPNPRQVGLVPERPRAQELAPNAGATDLARPAEPVGVTRAAPENDQGIPPWEALAKGNAKRFGLDLFDQNTRQDVRVWGNTFEEAKQEAERRGLVRDPYEISPEIHYIYEMKDGKIEHYSDLLTDAFGLPRMDPNEEPPMVKAFRTGGTIGPGGEVIGGSESRPDVIPGEVVSAKSFPARQNQLQNPATPAAESAGTSPQPQPGERNALPVKEEGQGRPEVLKKEKASDVTMASPATPPTKTTYTTLKKEWYGRKLEGKPLQLPYGESLPGPTGKPRAIFPPEWLAHFTRIDSRAKPLVEAVRAKTDEIMPLPNGMLYAPKKAVAEARAELGSKAGEGAAVEQAKADEAQKSEQRREAKQKQEVNRAAKIQGIEDRLRELMAQSRGGPKVNSAEQARKEINAEHATLWGRTQPNGSEAYLLAYLRDHARDDPRGTKYKWVEPKNLADGAKIKVGNETMTIDRLSSGETMIEDGITAEVDPETPIPAREVVEPKPAPQFFSADEAGASKPGAGIFGQPTFDNATGNKTGTMFHEPVDVPRPASEKIGSKEANRPENTGKIFGMPGPGGASAREPMGFGVVDKAKLKSLRDQIKTYREYEADARKEGDTAGAENLAKHVRELEQDLSKLSTPQPAGPKLASAPLANFAHTVQRLADASEKGFGKNKVFISDAYDAAAKLDPSLTLDQFKQRLIEAQRKGLVDLSRADLVSAMHPEDVERSDTHYLNGTFNFIQAAPKERTYRTQTAQESSDYVRQRFDKLSAETEARRPKLGSMADAADYQKAKAEARARMNEQGMPAPGAAQARTAGRNGPPRERPPVEAEKESNPIKEQLVGDKSFVGRDVVPTGASVAKTLHQAADQIRAIFAPQTRSPQAREEALLLREKGGELARKTDQAEAALRDVRGYLDKQPKEKNYAMVDAIEQGKPVGDLHVQPFVKVMRELLDGTRDEIRGLGTGKLAHFIENYFPHLWKDPKEAEGVFAKLVGRKPMEGPKSFLKQRTLPTFKDGIEAGLKPISDNPVDLVLLKLREMHRYLLAQRHFADMKEHGLMKFVPAFERPPEGYAKLEDRMFTVHGPPTIPVSEYVDEHVYDTLEKVASTLGVSHQRKMSAGGGRLGFSVVGGDKVVSKFGTGTQVLAHELGHQLDQKYDLWNKLLQRDSGKGHKPGRSELRDIADLTGREEYSRKKEEKIAQVLEAYIHARQRMEDVAPRVYKWFDNFIKTTPELAPLADALPNLKLKELEGQVAHGGMLIMGNYHAPEPVARVLNNHLAPGLRAKSGLFRAYLGANNVLNVSQLGVSFFHGGFATIDSMLSQNAAGLQHLMAGRPIKGLTKMLTAPAAPILSMFSANPITKAWFGKGGPGEEAANLMMKAGGRVRQDPFYRVEIAKKMMTAFRQGNYLGGLLRLPGAMLEKAAAPVMEHYVPRMKQALFAQQAEVEMMNLGPTATDNQVREALARAWDSVDNRLGQVVYDNLFWNRMAKDLAMASTRSLGWNLGTWREIGGGMVDTAKAVAAGGNANWEWWRDPESRGKTPMGAKEQLFTSRVAYNLSAVMMTAMAGGILGYAMTGKRPEELKDYFFPKTGETDKNGHPVRLALPTYLKDVAAYRQDPLRTLAHKASPMISMMTEMLSNEDYYGTEIRHADDPLMKQALDMLKHVGKSATPFSVRGYQQLDEEQAPASKKLLPFIGITQLSPKLSLTPAEELAEQLYGDTLPRGSRTQEQSDKSKVKADLYREMKKDLDQGVGTKGPAGQHMLELEQQGKLRPDEAKSVFDRAKESPIAYRVKRLTTVEDAMRVWRIASEQEKKELKPVIVPKIIRSKVLAPEQKKAFIGELMGKAEAASVVAE